ncbi:ABC transporter substrate-binding protein [Bradyrhizobium sp. 200]|uniref:ABC transporter substrate-binding protein n=1 Tax=Bradyrhizobium sp. 200 TaxID=2782665 RepID=UPI002000410E|nr:ABC transporter substrate-binding protein [Bradyrhizobium sp. 200]UPJ48424.1 ABC transporter substrate-binding protein [Bradyrhizobium sp. 200]
MRKVLSSVFVAALFFGPASGALAQNIKVGTIFPMSGPAGPSGIDAAAAVRVQVELLNKKGGLLGRKIVVSQKDDESTPAVGVSRANELVGEKADVIFEGRNSPVALAMQPIIAAANILDITCSAKAEAILSGKGNAMAIRIISSNEIDAEAIANYVIDIKKANRVAIMVQNDAYGNDFRQLIENRLKAASRPIEVVLSEKFPFRHTDFRVPLTAVKAANPDAVIVINAATSGMSALIEQYRQAGITAQFVAGITLLTPEVVNASKELINGIVSGSGYLPELEPLKDIPAAKEFFEAYQRETGRAAGEEAGIAAQAVAVWASAVRSTNSLDKTVVAQAIRGKGVKGTNFGDVQFAENGQMLTKPSLFRVVDGPAWRLELVK